MQKKIDFLWRTYEAFESRINLLDNKASIIIGIETAILAVTIFLVEKSSGLLNTAWI